ncbi:MAG TPA: riboflavin synthase [Gemmatimonadales bacterium]|nr:riboflavin synthase [Gemmatimonadales bacterium]
MFTGLVTAVGQVVRARRNARALELTIRAPYRSLAVGESVAVDGACLTVVRTGRGTFTVEAVSTTLGRTNFGAYRKGRAVNLERALKLGDRMGGHLVSGHVDGVGKVVRRAIHGDALVLDLEVPKEVRRLCIPHGSIAVDGVSMTVNALRRGNVVQISVVPHTREATTLGRARVGQRVHLEADQIGKFVQQLVLPYRAGRRTR